jgi:hypothetical protein
MIGAAIPGNDEVSAETRHRIRLGARRTPTRIILNLALPFRGKFGEIWRAGRDD